MKKRYSYLIRPLQIIIDVFIINAIVYFVYDLEYLNLIIHSLDSNHSLASFNPIYESSFLNLNDSIPLTQQIKLRKMNELLLNYNVCFNHLLNEFQSLFERAYFSGDSKTALAITRKMSEENYTELKKIIPTKTFESLSELKQQLDDKFSYAEIRLVLNDLAD